MLNFYYHNINNIKYKKIKLKCKVKEKNNLKKN